VHWSSWPRQQLLAVRSEAPRALAPAASAPVPGAPAAAVSQEPMVLHLAAVALRTRQDVPAQLACQVAVQRQVMQVAKRGVWMRPPGCGSQQRGP
jgi:hypothetical protein